MYSFRFVTFLPDHVISVERLFCMHGGCTESQGPIVMYYFYVFCAAIFVFGVVVFSVNFCCWF